MPHADVAVAVHHALIGQDAVGGDEVVDQRRVDGAGRGGRLPPRAAAGQQRGGGAGGGRPEKAATRCRAHERPPVRAGRRVSSARRKSSSAATKASSAGVCGLSRRRTRPIWRCSGGTSRIAISVRSRTSCTTENQDRKSTRLNSSHGSISYA